MGLIDVYSGVFAARKRTCRKQGLTLAGLDTCELRIVRLGARFDKSLDFANKDTKSHDS